MGMTQADVAAGGMPPAGQADMEAQPAGTPESNMQAMEQERMAQMEAIAQAAPPPEKPFTTTLITKLVDAVNSFVTKIDPNMAQIEFVPEGPKHEKPLPPEVFVPIVLVMAFVDSLGEKFEKMVMDPSDLVNDAALRKAISVIQMMEKNQELIDAIAEGGPTGEDEEMMADENLPPEGQAGEPMADMNEDDEALMASM